jgi:hypothetical protein
MRAEEFCSGFWVGWPQNDECQRLNYLEERWVQIETSSNLTCMGIMFSLGKDQQQLGPSHHLSSSGQRFTGIMQPPPPASWTPDGRAERDHT